MIRRKKVALVMPDDFSLWQPRRGLIKYLIESGLEVYTISAPGKYVELIENLGAVHIPVHMNRFFSPKDDIKYLLTLYKIFRIEKFDIIHNFTTKPNIYGAIAGYLAGVERVVCSVEGLGHSFINGNGMKWIIIKNIVINLYRLSCYLAHKTRFMNNDDVQFFLSKRIISKDKVLLIIGEGVNLKEYDPEMTMNSNIDELRERLGGKENHYVVMVARVNWLKGVREFIDASVLVSKKYKNVKFLLIGPIDDGPLAVPKEYLEQKASNNFQWLGFVNDLRDILIISDIIVLPSYLREGVPNCLIEGMAMGKPVITTDNVGCREVVDEGKNGYLIPIKDPVALSERIEEMLNDPDKLKEFGKNSRLKVESEFDENIMAKRIVDELYEIKPCEKPFRKI